MVKRTVILETNEQQMAFDNFLKSNDIKLADTVTPADLALGRVNSMSDADWDLYFESYPISTTGKNISQIIDSLKR